MTDMNGSESFQIPADATVVASSVPEPVAPEAQQGTPEAATSYDGADRMREMWIKGQEMSQTQLPEGMTDFGQWYDTIQGITEAQGTPEAVVPEGEVEIPALNTDEVVETTDEDAKLEIEDPESKEAKLKKQQTIAESWDSWGTELATNLTLSDDTRQQIKDTMGVPDAVIDHYIAGFKADTQKQYNDAATYVGSTEKLNAVLNWASTSMSVEQRTAANTALAGPNREIYLTGLMSQYDKANPTQVAKSREPSARKPGTTSAAVPTSVAPKAFSSEREMGLAMRDPRYRTDAAYQQEVVARLQATYGK